MIEPPRDEAELLVRVAALQGWSIDALAQSIGPPMARSGARTKGKIGELVERALGATGGSRRALDFPELRIELKTVPVDDRGAPRESTFVCAVSLLDAERQEWADSWTRAKLSRVLWVPIEFREGRVASIGKALLWSPTAEQESVLAQDFEDILGRVSIGDIEATTARVGRWLQLRPKAAHSRVRTLAPGADGELIPTVPRGLYLRALFTSAILRDPAAFPIR
ncbi:MAG TPA: MutH/Sau3AI family endonuclease [Polyangiaceae bacterium]|nr:MutH/Sau3AI family endonuclease [Polyangiaceae bacterium]